MDTIFRQRPLAASISLLILVLLPVLSTVAQPNSAIQKVWRIALQRKDGKEIIFQLEKTGCKAKQH